ncbi:MAG: glycosyltransferase [Lachnospiraceae bacterium]|nr:glycosyltransferase [Lachnospiraceae bacterium]
MTDLNPDVSVYMLTYFHEKYIRQAIDAVLAQKTHYSFEIVISDDHSEDGTVDILREYEAGYPDIIRINVNETNLGIPGNIYKARCMCRGRYVAVCSGDDYWIRDDKLETQVSFMDAHPDYAAVCNRVELRMDGGDTAYDVVPHEDSRVNRLYTLDDYEKCRRVGLHGCVMRNFFLTEEGREYFGEASRISRYVDDAVDELLLLMRGPIYVMDFASDAHRVVPSDSEHKNYNSRYTRLEKFTQHIELLNGLNERWGDRIDFSYHYAEHYAVGRLGMLVDRSQRGDYRSVVETIPQKFKRPWYKSIYIKSLPYIIRTVLGRLKRR